MPDQVHIALWGPSGAGKTLYLAQLYFAQSSQAEWDIYPGLSEAGDHNSIPEDDQFVSGARQRLQTNRFPIPTDPGSAGIAVRYLLTHRTTGQTASLFARDRAGKDWLDLDTESEQQLRSATALILLFDSASDLRQLEIDVERTLERLRRISGRGPDSPKDPRPVAVCMAKADQLIRSYSDLTRIQSSGESSAFVIEQTQGNLRDWVSTYCERAEYFPISSVGVRVQHGAIERLWFFDEKMEARIASYPKPLNLMKPFEWIFQQMKEGQQ